MDKYDKPAGIDKTSQVQGKVDHVKGIMQVSDFDLAFLV